MWKKLLATTALACALTAPAHASLASCVVDDPTGTPLNVRTSPNGPIVGALHNGASVGVVYSRMSADHKVWFFVVPEGPGKSGFVYSQFLDCQWNND
jgi:hypothetical protein